VPALDGEPLQSIDPGGAIAAAIPFERVVGCVVHASASSPEPGLVRHATGQGLIVGEPAGGTSERAQKVAHLLGHAGFEATVSALTGATIDRVLADPLLRAYCTAAMREAAAVGERIGCRIEQTPEDRHAITARLGAFKTSMLQDVEAGRAIELDAIVGSVHEIGRRVGVSTPHIDALFGLTRLFARTRGLYPAPDPAA